MATIAIVMFDGFNEIDSLVALHLVGRARGRGLEPLVIAPNERVTSMNGVTMDRQGPLEATRGADAVLFGSGKRTLEVAADGALLARIAVDPARQLIGAQCSGAFLIAKVGLLAGVPACTDRGTSPRLVEAGFTVLDRPLFAHGNVATAGGCMSSVFLASWAIARLVGVDAARDALAYVAPVGEETSFVDHAIATIRPFV